MTCYLSQNHRKDWSLAYALRWSFASNESPRVIKRIKYPWTSNQFARSMHLAPTTGSSTVQCSKFKVSYLCAISAEIKLQPTITIENVQLTEAEIVALFKDALLATSANLNF